MLTEVFPSLDILCDIQLCVGYDFPKHVSAFSASFYILSYLYLLPPSNISLAKNYFFVFVSLLWFLSNFWVVGMDCSLAGGGVPWMSNSFLVFLFCLEPYATKHFQANLWREQRQFFWNLTLRSCFLSFLFLSGFWTPPSHGCYSQGQKGLWSLWGSRDQGGYFIWPKNIARITVDKFWRSTGKVLYGAEFKISSHIWCEVINKGRNSLCLLCKSFFFHCIFCFWFGCLGFVFCFWWVVLIFFFLSWFFCLFGGGLWFIFGGFF